MTFKECVEKTQESNLTLERKKIVRAYVMFYIAMTCIYVAVLLWSLAVLSVVSTGLAVAVEVLLSVIFVYLVEVMLKASTASEKAFNRVRVFGKTAPIWGILLVASFVAVVYLKANFLL